MRSPGSDDYKRSGKGHCPIEVSAGLPVPRTSIKFDSWSIWCTSVDPLGTGLNYQADIPYWLSTRLGDTV